MPNDDHPKRLFDALTEHLVRKSNENFDRGFEAVCKERMEAMRGQFHEERGEWITNPINDNTLIKLGKELSERGLVHAKMDIATTVVGNNLLNSRRYQFIDASGRSRVDKDAVAITKEIFTKLLIPARFKADTIQRLKEIGINHINPLQGKEIDFIDPLDPLAPLDTKYYVMRLTDDDYRKLPYYVLSEAIRDFIRDEIVAMSGGNIPTFSSSDPRMTLLKRIMNNVEILASHLKDKNSEIMRVFREFCPTPRDQDIVMSLLVTSYQSQYDMRYQEAQQTNKGDIYIEDRRDNIKSLLMPHLMRDKT